jgi:hypothetical protein
VKKILAVLFTIGVATAAGSFTALIATGVLPGYELWVFGVTILVALIPAWLLARDVVYG